MSSHCRQRGFQWQIGLGDDATNCRNWLCTSCDTHTHTHKTHRGKKQKHHVTRSVLKLPGYDFEPVEPVVFNSQIPSRITGPWRIFLLRLPQKTPVITFKTSSKWVTGELEDVGGVNLNVYIWCLDFLFCPYSWMSKIGLSRVVAGAAISRFPAQLPLAKSSLTWSLNPSNLSWPWLDHWHRGSGVPSAFFNPFFVFSFSTGRYLCTGWFPRPVSCSPGAAAQPERTTQKKGTLRPIHFAKVPTEKTFNQNHLPENVIQKHYP